MAADGAGPLGEEARFRLLADRTPTMIWRSDRTGGGDFFNTAWLEFTGRTMADALGEGWTAGIHPEDRATCRAAYAEAFAARREFTLDYRLRRHDGAWRWLRDSGKPCIVAGSFAGFIGSCFDITDMKQALEERQRALDQREALLAELHHRVKNNAQATTSFLGLQANRASEPAVEAALRSAATRVMLATLVQDRMFRVPIDSGIELGSELATTARAALDVVAHPGVRLEVAMEAPLCLPVAQATPLALIVTELVVNAARHAFPGGRAGTIRLAVRHAGPGLGEVVVEDDGIGLAAALPRRTPQGCLGLHLAPRLARQAHACLTVHSGAPPEPPGTRATLRFACG